MSMAAAACWPNTGKPLAWTWDGAEKNYADFQLEVTNPGGHSSAPRKDNAIVQLSQALVAIGAYHFTPEQSPLTKAFFESAARSRPTPSGRRDARLRADPTDADAIATLRSLRIHRPHRNHACPRWSTAVTRSTPCHSAPRPINCRIFPGHKREDIMAELAKVANMPVVKFSDVTEGSTRRRPARCAPISSMRRTRPFTWPIRACGDPGPGLGRLGLDVVPRQRRGRLWRQPVLIKDSEEFAHGLNERVPLSNIAPGVVYFTSLFTDLSK
jgi:acetylornithine deacetylase/succinyl-diaminopimelate desuccinylase-like protein